MSGHESDCPVEPTYTLFPSAAGTTSFAFTRNSYHSDAVLLDDKSPVFEWTSRICTLLEAIGGSPGIKLAAERLEKSVESGQNIRW
jgi:hypothetical protein